jgi:hypothetical protein
MTGFAVTAVLLENGGVALELSRRNGDIHDIVYVL